ncbi:hypothetical protein PQX77_000658 [Marasmius sp. AFHP31]|nr:hypothetical protein PQX77_000658 [Marasmius sp. AFHP31]
MEGLLLTDTELEQLSRCIYNVRLGDGILFAGSALFFFDYLLTFGNEVKFLSTSRRPSLGTAPFVICRYSALGTAILAVTPVRSNATVDSVGTVLRLAAIIASEIVLAVRTWAIWGRNRKVLYSLLIVALCAVIPAAIIVGKALTTNQIRPLITPELTHLCSATVSDIKIAFIVPYILTICYEILTLTLSLYRIAKWRQSIPENIRAPLLDTLWRDGIMYFSFMLLLSFMNIGIVLQSEVWTRNHVDFVIPGMTIDDLLGPSAAKWWGKVCVCVSKSRVPEPYSSRAISSLQAILHSMMACRIVLHLATSNNPRDITNPAISAYADMSDIQFTTQIAAHETVERLPVSRREEDNEE